VKPVRTFRKQTKLWKTKEGHRLRICDMTDQHIKNAMRYLRRAAEESLSNEISAAYSVSSSFNPDGMAAYYADQDIERMEGMCVDEWIELHYPIYELLEKDAIRRGLATP
jgi:hypothetical protein